MNPLNPKTDPYNPLAVEKSRPQVATDAFGIEEGTTTIHMPPRRTTATTTTTTTHAPTTASTGVPWPALERESKAVIPSPDSNPRAVQKAQNVKFVEQLFDAALLKAGRSTTVLERNRQTAVRIASADTVWIKGPDGRWSQGEVGDVGATESGDPLCKFGYTLTDGKRGYAAAREIAVDQPKDCCVLQ